MTPISKGGVEEVKINQNERIVKKKEKLEYLILFLIFA